MSAGGTLEVWYPMTGPIPAGTYHISVGGYQSSKDAQLHADLLFRPQAGAEQQVATADSTILVGSDAGLPGDIDTDVAGAAAPGARGDLLVLRVKMLSGTSGYIELGTSLTLPR